MATSFSMLAEALRQRAGARSVDPAFHQALDAALDAHKAERTELDAARKEAAEAVVEANGVKEQLAALKAEVEALSAAQAEPKPAPKPKAKSKPKAK